MLVDENEVCDPRTQWLKQDGVFTLRLNLDDVGISDQHGLEGSLKHNSGPGAELKRYAKSIGGSVYVKDKRRQ